MPPLRTIYNYKTIFEFFGFCSTKDVRKADTLAMMINEQFALYQEDIVYCLVRYSGMPRDHALLLVAGSRILEPWTSPHRENILHELPYYWAMHLTHARRNPDWYLDEKLWPPPESYLDHLRRMGNAVA